MAPTASRDGSSTSARRPSPTSPRSARASRTSPSPGSSLTPSALRALAARHGITPRKSLGQHFLIEPALARRIAELAGMGEGANVLEIGAGLGSLTQALARTGAHVVAVEVDPRLVAALEEVLAGHPEARWVEADALRVAWGVLLDRPGAWSMVANLPYNVAVPVVMRALEEEPRIDRFLVMVQREVGERLAAPPGHPAFGALSLHVAYRAEVRIVRPISRTVFWPQPNVDSVLIRLDRRPPPVDVEETLLWRVVDEAFSQRRKSIRAALVRLGLSRSQAEAVLRACGVEPLVRPEQLGLEAFACLARGATAFSPGTETGRDGAT